MTTQALDKVFEHKLVRSVGGVVFIIAGVYLISKVVNDVLNTKLALQNIEINKQKIELNKRQLDG